MLQCGRGLNRIKPRLGLLTLTSLTAPYVCHPHRGLSRVVGLVRCLVGLARVSALALGMGTAGLPPRVL